MVWASDENPNGICLSINMDLPAANMQSRFEVWRGRAKKQLRGLNIQRVVGQVKQELHKRGDIVTKGKGERQLSKLVSIWKTAIAKGRMQHDNGSTMCR